MDGIYPSVSRQMSLLREMDTIAQNIANANTTGYRAEGLTFSEFIKRSGDAPSLSMGHVSARQTDWSQGALERTGGTFDFAIEGEGFFQLGGDAAVLLTRSGSFTRDANGGLVTFDGLPVLDAGGAPIQVPPGDNIVVGPDGTISQNGAPVAQLGVVLPEQMDELVRLGNSRFEANTALNPVDAPKVLQGAVEASNTKPVLEIARMIEVQNAYSLGQAVLEREDERLRSMFRIMDQ